MGMAKIEIHMEGTGRGYISVNGFRLPDTYDIAFHSEAGRATRVIVSMWAERLTVTGDAEVEMQISAPDEAALLERLIERAAERVQDTVEVRMARAEYLRRAGS